MLDVGKRQHDLLGMLFGKSSRKMHALSWPVTDIIGMANHDDSSFPW